MEPIRARIQSTVNRLRSLCSGNAAESPSRPIAVVDEKPAEGVQSASDIQRQAQTSMAAQEMRLRADQAKADAEATRLLAADVEDLNQIMLDLGNLVHAQHDMVDSIEEHCERAEREVRSGQRQLRQAAAANTAKYPLAAAAVGSLALGGPVGLAAGSAIAGVVTAVIGAVGGFYGGQAFKRKVQRDIAADSSSSSTKIDTKQ